MIKFADDAYDTYIVIPSTNVNSRKLGEGKQPARQ
jgi:hypothetical protein